jgi:hypothetical protein
LLTFPGNNEIEKCMQAVRVAASQSAWGQQWAELGKRNNKDLYLLNALSKDKY